MRKLFTLMLLLGILSVTNAQNPTLHQNHKKTVSAKLKSYTNAKYGFAFQYPSSWLKQGNDAEITDRNGKIISFEINFADTTSHTTLLVAYHLAPNGAELYNYALSQFKSSQGWYEKDGKQLKVAGNIAIEANTKRELDGKGNKLPSPTKAIIVDFLDKNKTGEFQLQLTTPVANENKQVALFNQLLATFKLSNSK